MSAESEHEKVPLVRHLDRLAATGLAVKVTLAMLAGLAFGLLLGDITDWLPPRARSVLLRMFALPGEVFLALLQMMVVPLVFASIGRGIAQFEGFGVLRAVGLRFLLYTLATTTVAITVGLTLAQAVAPGRWAALTTFPQPPPVPREATATAPPPSLLEALIPQNPLRAMVEGQMLEVVSFAVIVGVAMVSVNRTSITPILDLLRATLDVSMAVVRGAMRLAPLAVFGLSLQAAASSGMGALGGVGAYVLTVFFGLAILVGVYTVTAWVVAGRSPRAFLRAAWRVGVLAFSTSSSAAVMPLSIRTARQDLGVREGVARLVIPLGATMNMDGTALYQTVATVFLAQVAGVDLGPAALLALILTILTASIGTPSAPGLGIVVLSSILRDAGIPAAAIGLVFGVDRLLDMARTAVNVTSDLACCAVVDQTLPEPACPEAPPT